MLPVDFCERMQAMLGDEYQAFIDSYEKEKYQSLRFNTIKGDLDGFEQRNDFHLHPVSWNPLGFYYDAEDMPGKHPFHEAGVYYIQEASAMAPAIYLEAKPGERVLDLCAAPGGKSTQIAAMMKGEGLLISNEIHAGRAKILSENVERMGIRNAVVVNETPQSLHKAFPEFFHRIMVDAPCSGEGMFRKQEDATEEWSLDNVSMCGGRQDEILEEAYGMLLPGGRMVYSTCTFAPEENEGSVSRFVATHPDMHLVEVYKYEGMSDGQAIWYEKFASHESDYLATENIPVADGIERTIRLFPHQLEGEGHFVAVLQKDGVLPEGIDYKKEKLCSMKDMPELKKFVSEVLSEAVAEEMTQSSFLKFGDQVYLAPQDLPRLKGLKVLRPGLHLGTIKKNRLEPSHAWALALNSKEVKRSCELHMDKDTIFHYLNGETFDASREELQPSQENGWYLITIEGYSIGWGKLTGVTMKNHYPKGLRKNIWL